MTRSFLFLLLVLQSCSSLKPGESVVATMDGKSKPEWAFQAEVPESKDGKIRFLGFEEVDGDSRVSAALELADYRTMNNLSGMISTKFNSIFQKMDEGLKGQGNMSREYGTKVTKSIIRHLRISGHFWEKVQIVDVHGNPDLRLRVYALAEIRESHLRSLIDETLGSSVPEAIKKQAEDSFIEEMKKF